MKSCQPWRRSCPVQQLPAFATLALGNRKLLLSGPGASGSRPLHDGRQQEPGGWNRVVLQVADLPAHIDALKKAGLHFRSQMEVGPGGKQIQLAIALLVPSIAVFGALALVPTMVGAIATELFIAGGSPVPPAVLLLGTAFWVLDR